MLKRTWRSYVLLVGLAAGVAASVYVPEVLATRNSSGVYSLPSGNPVVSGNAISSTWANTTLADLATEITNSLDRNGRGAMLQPLQCASGSVAAPALTFSADTDTGLYRGGANDIRMSSGATYVQGWLTTGAVFPVNATTQAGLTATQSITNGHAITATGNGTGKGLVATGGATSHGVTGYGGGALNAVNTRGVEGFGNGTGEGGAFTGGTGGGHGVVGVGLVSGAGGVFTGGPTGTGMAASAGGSPTANTNTRYALETLGGHIKLSGGDPSSSTSFANTLTPMNLIKAFANITTSSGTVTVTNGFNIDTDATAVVSNCVRLHWKQDFSGTGYAAIVSGTWHGNRVYHIGTKTAAYVDVCALTSATEVAAPLSDGANFSVLAMGAQ